MGNQIVFGSSVLENHAPHIDCPLIRFPGKTLDGNDHFSLSEDLLSRHVLLLGGSGCGKTNAFCYSVEELRANMTEEDIAIIFDTKGEFYDWFSKPGDYVIGNSGKFRQQSFTWNIFDELLADGDDDQTVSMNAREIAASLFSDRKSESQPFFCDAARDIFRAILVFFTRKAKEDPLLWSRRLNNRSLLGALETYTARDYAHIFASYPDFKNLITYIGDGTSNQALGVFGELNSMVSDYFVGIFADHRLGRSLSMRKAVRAKGAKAIFVEYDLSIGETLTPVYRLLIDQALKEALGRFDDRASRARVFLIADEFKLLPKLQHIDDALNFGRGLGVRVMAGIQSIDQLYDVYGEKRGAVVASGFGSLFAFHTNDSSSREYITRRFGSNVMVYDYHDAARNAITYGERNGNTVEEWDQLNLGLGQAVIGLGYEAPFLFQFTRFDRE